MYRIILFLLLCVGCQSSNDGERAQLEEKPSLEELPIDFIQFYQRFHDDSLFQVARIQFPLSGLPSNDVEISAGTDFKWERKSWRMHKPMDPKLSGYQKTFSKFEDGVIIENISHNQVDVAMERRFAKLGGQWTLIYYAAMRQK